MSSFNQSFFSGMSERSRTRKLEILNQCFDFGEETRVLDVGGQVEGSQAQFINQYPYKHNITVVNLLERHLEAIHEKHPEITTQLADARKLPFEDDAFDLVFSNAVIEHVGGWADQVAMANEVMRVSKNWFITTPNRWFPFELHLRLPFVSWLPSPALMRVASWFSYDHVQRRYRSGIQQQLRLLGAGEMRRLFPDSAIVPVQITVMPETLIAMGGEQMRRPEG